MKWLGLLFFFVILPCDSKRNSGTLFLPAGECVCKYHEYGRVRWRCASLRVLVPSPLSPSTSASPKAQAQCHVRGEREDLSTETTAFLVVVHKGDGELLRVTLPPQCPGTERGHLLGRLAHNPSRKEEKAKLTGLDEFFSLSWLFPKLALLCLRAGPHARCRERSR